MCNDFSLTSKIKLYRERVRREGGGFSPLQVIHDMEDILIATSNASDEMRKQLYSPFTKEELIKLDGDRDNIICKKCQKSA